LLVALAAVFALGIAGAPPALATQHGTSTGSWNHGGGSATASVFTNEFGAPYFGDKDGTVVFSKSGPAFWVNFDYVRLYRNGVQVQANNTDQYRAIAGGFQVSTPRHSRACSTGTGTYYTIARYQFTHAADGHISGWITRQSGSWTDTSDCSD
jgi:hypothetical protein